jgi:hypothetical protein
VTPGELDEIEARVQPLVGAASPPLRWVVPSEVVDLIAALREAWAAIDDGRAAVAQAGVAVERASAEVTRAHRALTASNAERGAARERIAELEGLLAMRGEA